MTARVIATLLLRQLKHPHPLPPAIPTHSSRVGKDFGSILLVDWDTHSLDG